MENKNELKKKPQTHKNYLWFSQIYTNNAIFSLLKWSGFCIYLNY